MKRQISKVATIILSAACMMQSVPMGVQTAYAVENETVFAAEAEYMTEDENLESANAVSENTTDESGMFVGAVTTELKQAENSEIQSEQAGGTVGADGLITYTVKTSNNNGKAIFNPKTREYTIKGTGILYGDASDPWNQEAEKAPINKIIIEKGITGIDNCFRTYSWDEGAVINIHHVQFPEGFKTIEGASFYGCEIKEIMIPSTVTAIAYNAFSNNHNLEAFQVHPENKYFATIDGVLCTKDLKKILFYPAGKKDKRYEIPACIETMGTYVFDGCYNLESLTLPSTIKPFNEGLLDGCMNLKELIINCKVTAYNTEYLGYMINKPYSLETLVLEEGFDIIPQNFFANSGKIKKVFLPKSLKEIKCDEFVETLMNSEEVYYAGTAEEFAKIKLGESVTVELFKTVAKKIAPNHVHSYVKEEMVQKASMVSNGKSNLICECGHKVGREYQGISEIILSQDKFEYDGSVHIPAIIVKDKAGNVIDASNYTVSALTDAKSVGTNTLAVTFKNKYEGSVQKSYTIFAKAEKPGENPTVDNPNPSATTLKATSITKLTPSSKGFTVKWKKRKGVTGYQIQCCLSKKFKKGVKKVSVKKAATTKKAVGKLKANKTYYVRVRTYKTMKVNGTKKTTYSKWSKVKRVKTKSAKKK